MKSFSKDLPKGVFYFSWVGKAGFPRRALQAIVDAINQAVAFGEYRGSPEFTDICQSIAEGYSRSYYMSAKQIKTLLRFVNLLGKNVRKPLMEKIEAEVEATRWSALVEAVFAEAVEEERDTEIPYWEHES